MAGVNVQCATSDDAIGLAAVTMRRDLERGGVPDPTFIRQYADAWLDVRSTQPAWIAKMPDGNPVGFALGAHVAVMPSLLRTGGGWLHLSTVYVDADRRRQGIGEQLLGAVREWARAHDVSRIQLTTDEVNREFYETVGFEQSRDRLMHSWLRKDPQPELRLF